MNNIKSIKNRVREMAIQISSDMFAGISEYRIKQLQDDVISLINERGIQNDSIEITKIIRDAGDYLKEICNSRMCNSRHVMNMLIDDKIIVKYQPGVKMHTLEEIDDIFVGNIKDSIIHAQKIRLKHIARCDIFFDNEVLGEFVTELRRQFARNMSYKSESFSDWCKKLFNKLVWEEPGKISNFGFWNQNFEFIDEKGKVVWNMNLNKAELLTQKARMQAQNVSDNTILGETINCRLDQMKYEIASTESQINAAALINHQSEELAGKLVELMESLQVA